MAKKQKPQQPHEPEHFIQRDVDMAKVNAIRTDEHYLSKFEYQRMNMFTNGKPLTFEELSVITRMYFAQNKLYTILIIGTEDEFTKFKEVNAGKKIVDYLPGMYGWILAKVDGKVYVVDPAYGDFLYEVDWTKREEKAIINSNNEIIQERNRLAREEMLNKYHSVVTEGGSQFLDGEQDDQFPFLFFHEFTTKRDKKEIREHFTKKGEYIMIEDLITALREYYDRYGNIPVMIKDSGKVNKIRTAISPAAIPSISSGRQAVHEEGRRDMFEAFFLELEPAMQAVNTDKVAEIFKGMSDKDKEALKIISDKLTQMHSDRLRKK